jgi:phospholipase C
MTLRRLTSRIFNIRPLFFESDLGTIRLYDRLRLDVDNVRPITELDDTLRTGRDTGQLPRVLFIEPEFLFGNDDHPPMNIPDGQAFTKQVIGKFIDFGLLDRVLFLITYDEHGGYFNNVPPPGTAGGPSEWIGKIESLYPQEPDKARPRSASEYRACCYPSSPPTRRSIRSSARSPS